MKFHLAVLPCVLVAVVTAQTTRLVPSQYPTIQGAIAASANGDTVLVSPGVFPGAINLLGKAVTVVSSSGASLTTILGSAGPSVVTFASNEPSTCVLNGFTITGGGGGIFIQNSSPTIQNCQISGNMRSGRGGGISCVTTGTSTASPTITGCKITNNLTVGFGGCGVAFDCQSSAVSFPIVTNCLVSSNSPSASVSGAAQGGGFAMYGKCTATLTGCTIQNNSTFDVGGGLYMEGPSAFLTSCRFIGNSSAIGGAIYSSASSVSLISCLIADNSASQIAGALWLGTSNSLPPVSLTIKNCTISGNSAAFNGGFSAFGNGAPTITIVNSILWGNSGTDLETTAASVTYSDVGFGWYTPGAGSISSNPLFVDAAGGDYRLSTASPCHNGGAPGTVGLPANDLDGAPRIVGPTVDIGSDEVPSLAYPGTADGLDLYCVSNGAGDPLASTRGAVANDLVTVRMVSPGGTLVGGLPLFAARLYFTGNAFAVPGGGIWLDGQSLIVYGALIAPPFGFPGLPPAGLEFNFTVPAGLAGRTIRMQGLVSSGNALNGMYATTNATEVTF